MTRQPLHLLALLILSGSTSAQSMSFELSTPGPLPVPGPNPDGWFAGAGTLTIVPFGPIAGTVSGFPTDNLRCAIVNSSGAAGNITPSPAGVPPTLPLPPGSSARIRHPISIPSAGGPFTIQFDWTYVSGECPGLAFNDFFTVDLTNAAGARLLNLLYIDTISLVMVMGAVTPAETGALPQFPCWQVREAAPVGAPKTKNALLPSSLNGQTIYFEVNVGDVQDSSYPGYAWIDDIRLVCCAPSGTTIAINLSQPSGPGSISLMNTGLSPGVESYNIISLEPAPGGPGTGPYLGLWTGNLSLLLDQFALPLGTLPFHFTSTSPTFFYGPLIGVPPGLSLETVAFSWTDTAVGQVSPVASLTTQ